MANRNDYNYYKNEYGKYKESYYSPGSEEYKKRRNNSMKQKVGRYLRAAVVFLVIAAAVVGIVFGIIGLTNLISNKTPESTTIPPVENTTVSEDVTNKNDSEFKKGAVCIVKTEEGNGVNLRSEPTYDVPAYQLVADGEKIVIAEISKDGKWCKTSNFKNNGWLNLKYLVLSTEEVTTEEITTEKPTEEVTTAKPEVTTEGSTQTDNNITSYADAMKAFKEKGNGAVMNCKIVGSGVVYAMSKPDASSARLLYLVAGNEVKVIDINGAYSKVKALGYEGWVPNENLTFVSWAN